MSMENECKEAIILCGGNGWRLKPDTWTPKPDLQVNHLSLLEHQVKWLQDNGFIHIVIASDKEYYIRPILSTGVEFSIETFKKGTGGAVLLAIDRMSGKSYYVMNVDDILFYNPRLMLIEDKSQAKIVASKHRLGFGQLLLRQDLVLGFKEKPFTDDYVSTGHYMFKKHIVETYFPDNGNLEDLVLPELAKRRLLTCYRYYGKWIPINTYKDYLDAKEALSET